MHGHLHGHCVHAKGVFSNIITLHGHMHGHGVHALASLDNKSVKSIIDN
jgi:hypothetical protein